MVNELLAYFTRGRRSGSQIGVFATPEGVAAAEVTPRAEGQAAARPLRVREARQPRSVRSRARPIAEPACADRLRARPQRLSLAARGSARRASRRAARRGALAREGSHRFPHRRRGHRRVRDAAARARRPASHDVCRDGESRARETARSSASKVPGSSSMSSTSPSSACATSPRCSNPIAARRSCT